MDQEATVDAKPSTPAKREAPPGPSEMPFVGSSFDLIRDPLEFLDRVSRVYGDAVRFRMPGQTIYLFNHPDAIEEILVTKREHLIKDKLTRELSILLGNGLLVSEGGFWRKQRKLAQPGFHRERVAAYGDVMVDYTARAVDAWAESAERDVHHDMMRLTLDIVGKTLFGIDLADTAQHDKVGSSLEVLMDRFSGAGAIIPPFLPTPGNLRAKKAIALLDEVTYAIIRERRAEGDKGDLISMLIAATSEDDDGRMTDVQLRDEAMTLLLAGHETTALTLGYALRLLATHPEVQEKLAREIEDVLGDRPATAADLPRLAYAEAVVRESMRLFPPAWAIGREATAPIEIGGYHVPKGTQLWAAQWVTHRDPRWFADPQTFKPERWENGFAKTLPRYAYYPFGGGPRVCIGNAFAMMEAVLVLVTIARSYRFSDAAPLTLAPSVTLRPKDGIRLSCRRR